MTELRFCSGFISHAFVFLGDSPVLTFGSSRKDQPAELILIMKENSSRIPQIHNDNSV